MDLAARTIPVHGSAVGSRWVRWFDEVGLADVPLVGGKNASLGEMVQALGSQGIRARHRQ